MKILRYYTTRNGKQPFIEWLEDLRDMTAAAQINTRVRRLTLGQMGVVELVGKGVFEMKINHGPGYRVYFSELGKEVLVLLLGGDKSSQKRDIEKAKVYWADHLERYHEKSRH